MLQQSKGGKRTFLCPHCYSDHITKCKVYGQTSFWCLDCRYWGPWSERLNVNPHQAVHYISMRNRKMKVTKLRNFLKSIFSFKWVCKFFKA